MRGGRIRLLLCQYSDKNILFFTEYSDKNRQKLIERRLPESLECQSPANSRRFGGALMSPPTPFSVRTKRGFSLRWFLTVCVVSAGLWVSGRQTVEAAGYGGFGATIGGDQS